MLAVTAFIHTSQTVTGAQESAIGLLSHDHRHEHGLSLSAPGLSSREDAERNQYPSRYAAYMNVRMKGSSHKLQQIKQEINDAASGNKNELQADDTSGDAKLSFSPQSVVIQ